MSIGELPRRAPTVVAAVVAVLGLLPACSSSGTPSNRPTEVLRSTEAAATVAEDSNTPTNAEPDSAHAPDDAGAVATAPANQSSTNAGSPAAVQMVDPPAPTRVPLPDNVRVMPDDLPPLKTFHLPDQFDKPQHVVFPAERPVVIAIGDRDGSPQLDGWTVPLVERFGDRIDFVGVALVTGIAPVFRGFVRGAIQRQRPDTPVLIDWTGEVTAPLDCEAGCANIYLVRPDGSIVLRGLGAATPDAVQAVAREIGRLLGDTPADE